MTPDPISKKATRSIRYGNLSCSQIDTTSTELSAGRLLRFHPSHPPCQTYTAASTLLISLADSTIFVSSRLKHLEKAVETHRA